MAVSDPRELLKRLLSEPSESGWLEFKRNNCDPEVIGSWVSACANAAILAGKDRAFMVFGVDSHTRKAVGTTVDLSSLKKGGENFVNWINRVIEPRLMMEFLDFHQGSSKFAIITVEPTYDRPVRFMGTEYIRIGENIRKLAEFPDHERALWISTGRRKFENSIALTHKSPQQISEMLDINAFFSLAEKERPVVERELMRGLMNEGFVIDDMEGGYDLTNLGAVLFAKDVAAFPSISGKAVRVIKYAGADKRFSEDEIEFKQGYAVGFASIIKYIMSKVSKKEIYRHGIRSTRPIYPETAIREIIANALIHQDFTLTGAGPVVEIYEGRIEVTNPGNSLIEIDRIIDERRSRNEKLASTMRGLGLCEERGGGLDKAVIEIEENFLPAPDFHSSTDSMRVVIFGPKSFSDLTKTEKMRACFFHCILRWLKNDFMSNTTLRERFMLDPGDYQAVSTVITESVRAKRIIPAEVNQGKRNAKYVPYWTRRPHRGNPT